MANNQRPWSPPQMIWSAVLAIVVWTAVGFSWFGHGFNWSTQGGAKRMTSMAVMDSLATICVAQARSAANSEIALKELSGLSRWKQAEFIESANWATMPGSDSPQNGVAEACAAKLRQT